MVETPLKKTRKLVNWEPSTAGRRALLDIKKRNRWNLKTAIEESLIRENLRQKGATV